MTSVCSGFLLVTAILSSTVGFAKGKRMTFKRIKDNQGINLNSFLLLLETIIAPINKIILIIDNIRITRGPLARSK